MDIAVEWLPTGQNESRDIFLETLYNSLTGQDRYVDQA